MIMASAAPHNHVDSAHLLSSSIMASLFIGCATATLLGQRLRTVILDAVFAPVAFWSALAIALVIPCRNCGYVADGWTIRNQMPYPMVWASAAACLVPIAHHALRHHGRRP